MARFRTCVAVGFGWCLGAQVCAAELPAFPGAEGFGSSTPGGRGGKVLFVTNLADSGPGSLRAACEADCPRIVVFRVGGLVRLEKAIVVRSPFLTLAGQSAPGDGICLRDYPFQVATHDVVVRYLRSRLGDAVGRPEDSIDLLNGSSNVVLDHCSATWSIDECLSLSGKVSNATVQWCLIAEPLDRSKHPKGAHGYGSLMRANGPVSLHHNLWAHARSRNPRFGGDYDRPPFPSFDFRNNVVYDFGHTCSGITQGTFPVNYVGNTLLPGPSSTAHTAITIGGPSDLTFYLQGNTLDGKDLASSDTGRVFSRMEIDGARQVRIVEAPFPAPPVRTLAAGEACEAVLKGVGASLPVRDAVDSRIVDEVRSRKGSIINSQAQVGGWPEYRSAEPARDSDGDGMPDAWESAHGLNPGDPGDAGLDRNGDGYTNVEEYLNSLTSTQSSPGS
jgi:hypothetical protein